MTLSCNKQFRDILDANKSDGTPFFDTKTKNDILVNVSTGSGLRDIQRRFHPDKELDVNAPALNKAVNDMFSNRDREKLILSRDKDGNQEQRTPFATFCKSPNQYLKSTYEGFPVKATKMSINLDMSAEKQIEATKEGEQKIESLFHDTCYLYEDQKKTGEFSRDKFGDNLFEEYMHARSTTNLKTEPTFDWSKCADPTKTIPSTSSNYKARGFSEGGTCSGSKVYVKEQGKIETSVCYINAPLFEKFLKEHFNHKNYQSFRGKFETKDGHINLDADGEPICSGPVLFTEDALGHEHYWCNPNAELPTSAPKMNIQDPASVLSFVDYLATSTVESTKFAKHNPMDTYDGNASAYTEGAHALMGVLSIVACLF